MLTLTTCHEQKLCVDCKNKSCMHAGQVQADCPKYRCDNKNPNDCENCEFIKTYAKTMRQQYATTSLHKNSEN